MRSVRLFCVVITTTVILAACGGHGATGTVPAAVSPNKSRGTLNVVIKVPSARRSAHRKRPNYVSPSTQSITIAIDTGAPVAYGLTPSSPGCTPTTGTGALVCTLTLSLDAGQHTGDFTTYNGADGTGDVLSTNSNVPITINAGAANTLGVVLNGDVAKVALSLASTSPVAGTAATIPLSVNAYDSNYNLIIGPGSYDNGPITLTDSDTSGATTLSTTSVSDPSVRVSVNYDGSAMPCGSVVFSVSGPHVEIEHDATLTPVSQSACIYVPNIFSASVTGFASSASGNAAPATVLGGLSPGRPSGVAFSGNYIYVSAWSPDGIYVYRFGDTSIWANISGSNTKLFEPQGMATDASGNIYVANESNTVTAYAASASGNVTPIVDLEGSNTGLNVPVDVAIDSAGKLYVANQPNNGGSVTIYSAGATGNVAPIATLTGPDTAIDGPSGIAISATGNIVVANSFSNTIATYSSSANGDAAPTSMLSGSNTRLARPQGIAFDSAGNLWVANLNTSEIDEFAAGATGNAAPIAEISGPSTLMSGPLFLGLRVTPGQQPDQNISMWSNESYTYTWSYATIVARESNYAGALTPEVSGAGCTVGTSLLSHSAGYVSYSVTSSVAGTCSTYVHDDAGNISNPINIKVYYN